MSLDETISSSCNILNEAKSSQLKTRAYVSVAWECPYEGKVDSDVVLDIASQMLLSERMNYSADTIGAAPIKC